MRGSPGFRCARRTGALVSGGNVSDDADDTSVGTVFRLKRNRRRVRITGDYDNGAALLSRIELTEYFL